MRHENSMTSLNSPSLLTSKAVESFGEIFSVSSNFFILACNEKKKQFFKSAEWICKYRDPNIEDQ